MNRAAAALRVAGAAAGRRYAAGSGLAAGLAAEHRRVDVAGAHRVDAYALRCQLQRQRLGQDRDATLRRAVHRRAGVALNAGIGWTG